MATQVYIITKEGRAYNDDGLHYVGGVMKKEFGVDFNDIEFNSGAAFNKPELLARQLEKHEDAYLVVSTSDDVIFIPKTVNPQIVNNLRENPEETSWRILVYSCNGTID